MSAGISNKVGKVFWITGLSGAGKTTLCHQLVEHLRTQDVPVVRLDGDELREVMNAVSAHSREERLQLALRYARLCHLISMQGIYVAIATISLFREVHEWNRENIQEYIEIYLDVPMFELVRRDPKQIYSRASKGELKDVVGVDFPIDVPQHPDVHITWEPGLTNAAAVAQIIDKITLKN